MKRLLLFTLSVLLFAACSDFDFNETTDNGNNDVEDNGNNDVEDDDNNTNDDDDDIIPGDSDTMKIEIEEDDTRTQLTEGKTTFSLKDAFSVFYRSNVRTEWLYDGEANTTSGTITALQTDTVRNAKDIVVIYPYEAGAKRNIERGTVGTYLPTTQSFCPNSFGIGSSVMVGQSEVNKVTMRNAVGWVKINVKGDGEELTNVVIQSNDNMQLSGYTQIDPSSAELYLAQEILEEGGDYRGEDSEWLPTTFINAAQVALTNRVFLTPEGVDIYIAIPPRTYPSGFNISIHSELHHPASYDLSDEISIERNNITDLGDIVYEAEINEEYILPYIEQMIAYMPSDLHQVSRFNFDHSDFGYYSMRLQLDHLAMLIFPCVRPDRNGNVYYSRFQIPNYGFGLGSSDIFAPYVWDTYYSLIDDTNFILKRTALSDEYKAYEAIAKTYRALFYLDMACLYDALPAKAPNRPEYEGELAAVAGLTVPIITETTTAEEAMNTPRATREEMFEFILSDLKYAEQHLANYTATEPTTPNLAAVHALMARAYLWLGGFDESYANVPTSTAAYRLAAEYARKVINESGAGVMSEYEWTNPYTGFNSVASSWIWSSTLHPNAVPNNLNAFVAHMCPEAWYGYSPVAGPGVSSKMYDRMGNNDIRKLVIAGPDKSYDMFEAYTTMDSEEWRQMAYLAPYTNFKFRPGSGERADYAIANATTLPIIRLEEMYFIEMEATAHYDEGSARMMLESFMSNYRDWSYSFSGDDLIEEIIFQKAVEFWGEGLVMFDMKRLDMGVDTTDANYPAGMVFKSDGRLARWNITIPAYAMRENRAITNPNPDPTYADIILQ
ncbi:MAG: RagB/SusD family nutrient uptake outer membrane protein [Alistipes sp.]|nr:RagB/SusD family nutrient uptake outer membrane protein [Alistipes sp.]